MKQKMTYSGYLYVGNNKPLPIDCNLHVEVIQEDEWGEAINRPDNNGVRIEGDFSFDLPPIQSHYEDGKLKQHFVQKNVVGTVHLHCDGEKSQFSVLITEKVAEIDILPNQLRRYFWTFLPVGKPSTDQLEIFPKEYRWGAIKMNRVYYSTDFRGPWNNEVSSIIVAPNKIKAREIMDAKLLQMGIEPGIEMYHLTEVDLTQEQALVLNRG